MSASTALHLEFSSDPANLPAVRSQMRDWCRTHQWEEKQTGEIVLALDEAITNVIRHGYHGEPGHPILLDAEMVDTPGDGPTAELRLRDFGQQVDPEQICGRDLCDVRPGGLGVHIIRAMTSGIEYRKAEGGGMLAILRKHRDHTAVPDAERRENS